MTRLGKLAGAAALLSLGFGYGVLAHRNELFPYTWLRELYRAGGRVVGPAADSTADALWVRVPVSGRDVSVRTADQLSALGYLQGYEAAPARNGILRHDPERVQPGINFVVSAHAPHASLMTMNGETLHTWSLAYERACPDKYDPEHFGQRFWRRARLLPDGGLIAIYDYAGLIRLDRYSQLQWALCEPYHHDVSLDGMGRFYTLRREPRGFPAIDRDRTVLDDWVVLINGTGEVLEEISLLDAIANSDYASLLTGVNQEILRTSADVLHTNAVRRIEGLQGSLPVFQEGRLLLSFRHLDLVAVLDPAQSRIVWGLTGLWHRQHEPVLLPGGRLLVFDNLGHHGKTRVLELDPATQEIAWSYHGDDEGFVSWWCGAAQRLQNGNTLITDSTNGRAVEVTPSGQPVWEFINGYRAGEDEELVALLIEVVRLRLDEISWLQ